MKETTNVRIERIGGYLHKIIEVKDTSGKTVNHIVEPIMVEFRPRDILQVIVGSSILAVPVAFTEETWKLGENLPLINIILLAILSLLFISAFVYFNFYRFILKKYIFEFTKRVSGIYLFSLIVVALILSLIQKADWQYDYIVSIKRVLIVAFPASMSAAVSDNIK